MPMIPQEALKYLKNKKLTPAFSYRDVWNEEHALGFTVAKATQLDVLSDIKSAVEKAIEDGHTFEHFKKNLKPTLQEKGWWGRKDMVDPVTGEKVNAQLGSDRRLKTIYDVNAGQAYRKGTWDRGMASSSHPYIMYCLGPSAHHREAHQSWAGVTLPKEDSFWNTHAPMNGWGCKCWLRFLTEATFQKYKAEGYPTPKDLDGNGGGLKPISTERPEVKMQTYVDKRTGRITQVPEGITPGFEWNPGTATGRATALKSNYRDKDNKQVSNSQGGIPSGIPVSKALVNKITTSKSAAVNHILAVIDGVHGDGDLPTLEIRKSNRRKVNGYFLPTLNGGADHIGLAASPYPEFTLAHEIGHFIDHNGLPGLGFESENLTLPAMKKVIDTIKESQTYKTLEKFRTQKKITSYWISSIELWARAYAQYIVVKSGDLKMKDQLDKILNTEKLKQWGHDEFVPISKAIDDMFVSKGWFKRNEN